MLSSLDSIEIHNLPPDFIFPYSADTMNVNFKPQRLIHKTLYKEFYIGITTIDKANMESELSMLQKIRWSDSKKDWEIVE